MTIDLYTTAYRGYVDESMLKRFKLLDEILSSNEFLIGLSNQSVINTIDTKFNLVSDLVLGFQFYCSETKPRKHKGGFTRFDDALSSIGYVADCIGAEANSSFDTSEIRFEVSAKFNLFRELGSIVRARVEKLQLTEHWSERKEYKKSNNAMPLDQMCSLLGDMMVNHFFTLEVFALTADFKQLPLCGLLIEQLLKGGVPCGWLSKTPVWDTSNIHSGIDFPAGSYPSSKLGVFTDPTDKLAMLYLD